MRSLWNQRQTPSTAADIERLQQQVQHLQIDYQEVVEDDRVQALRRKWRLFHQPLASLAESVGCDRCE